jgi:hypothetical protein
MIRTDRASLDVAILRAWVLTVEGVTVRFQPGKHEK